MCPPHTQHTLGDALARTLFWKYYFFTLRTELLKTLAVGEISSFLRRGNFAVVYSMWNSLLSINHIKGKGLGDISSWHVLAWVNEKASRADSHRLREIISILCAVSLAVKFHRGENLFSPQRRIRGRGASVKPWRREPRGNFSILLRLHDLLGQRAALTTPRVTQSGKVLLVTSLLHVYVAKSLKGCVKSSLFEKSQATP